MPRLAAAGLAVVALVATLVLGNRARLWNDQLSIADPPLALSPPRIEDPKTPRLSRHVVLILVDGLGAAESHLPYLDELRKRGIAATARVPYPTISRPNYVTILTGVPPRDSGVRANRVETPVGVDTVMDRAQAAGLRVATASDFGMLPSLFARHTPTLRVHWIETGDHVSPPPPVTWPVDEARRAASLDGLAAIIGDLAATDAAFIPVLVLDVDRAGHAAGVADEYRAAARAVDDMLRAAFAHLDLEHDTVIVTADHGHVGPGGHGGDEPDVSTVPLVIAGAGITPGALARDARLIDIAPTVAALLGIPAPGHAEGRALVELLALSPADAERRAAVDATRAHAIAAIVDVHDDVSIPWLLVGLACVAILVAARRRIRATSFTGILGFTAMFAVMIAITRGRLSPSYIPSLARTEKLGALGAAASIAIQLTATLRYCRDRAAVRANALVSIALSLAIVAFVRTAFSPPFYDVPSPFWMVAIPTIDLAAATCALGTLLALGISALRHR